MRQLQNIDQANCSPKFLFIYCNRDKNPADPKFGDFNILKQKNLMPVGAPGV